MRLGRRSQFSARLDCTPRTLPLLAALVLMLLIMAACGSGGSGTAGDSGAGSSSAPASAAASAAPAASSDAGNAAAQGATQGSTQDVADAWVATPAPAVVVDAAPAAVFPLELLGDGGTLEKTLPLALVAGDTPDALYVQCHRCGFYGDPEWEAGRPAASVAASLRINDGPWIDVTDANVRLFAHEAAAAGRRGAVNGGAYTIRFTVPLTGTVLAGLRRLPADGSTIDPARDVNRIAFRFNGTDGHSNGLRILDAQWRAGARNLTANPVRRTDPLVEKLIARAAADVAEGERLWTTEYLLRKNGLVDRTIRASCQDCHTEAGRDLQYFNYSDAAIVARSRFHGLTEQQGQRIAAYVRATSNLPGTGAPVVRPGSAPLPHVARARPWNPPYQPGAGLDSRPAHEWAAGAGLRAVLDDELATFDAMFGSRTPSQARIDAVLDTRVASELNVRELPVAVQLPDWNAWLPSVHPKDIWGPGSIEPGSTRTKPEGLFLDGPDNSQLDYRAKWQAAQAALDAGYRRNGGDWNATDAATRQRIYDAVKAFGTAWRYAQGNRGDNRMHARIGASRLAALAAQPIGVDDDGDPTSPPPAALRPFRDRARLYAAQWMAVRQWELSHAFGLEGFQRTFIDNLSPVRGDGEARGWIALDGGSGVFYIAPHMSGEADWNRFDWQLDPTQADYRGLAPRNTADSAYRTNQWYHLALALSASGRLDGQLGPVDYHYIPAWLTYMRMAMAAAGTDVTVAARYVAYQLKWAQLVDNRIPMRVASWADWSQARSSAGWGLRKFGADTMLADELAALAPAVRGRLANGWVKMLAATYAPRPLASFRRCTGDVSVRDAPADELYQWYAFCLDADTPQRASSRVAGASGAAGDTRPPRPTILDRSAGEIQLDGVLAFKSSTLPEIDRAALAPWDAWLKSAWPALDTTQR